jgi:hypothetical protein
MLSVPTAYARCFEASKMFRSFLREEALLADDGPKFMR